MTGATVAKRALFRLYYGSLQGYRFFRVFFLDVLRHPSFLASLFSSLAAFFKITLRSAPSSRRAHTADLHLPIRIGKSNGKRRSSLAISQVAGRSLLAANFSESNRSNRHEIFLPELDDNLAGKSGLSGCAIAGRDFLILLGSHPSPK